uniref:Uncharacterized protein n=1 Tax=Meloidogyne enterolobii TaxID=390850 RepID=A0A6V7XFR8_MELEN|nr:unnamed protein product [Meloidogyne enterolobii]
MDQILALSRLSIFSTTKPKFDINGALTTRREQITILINKQIEDFEAIGFDDREVEKKINKTIQAHRDKLQNISNDEGKRKLVGEYKHKVKKIDEECRHEREKSENFKGRIDSLNSMLKEIKEPIREEQIYKMRKASLNI